MGRLLRNPMLFGVGILFIALVAVGCSEEGLLTGPPSGDTAVTGQTDTNTNSDDTDGDTPENNSSEETNTDSDSEVETTVLFYTFDELSIDCSWDSESFPNPYKNMSFEEQPHWSICSGTGIKGMAEPVIKPMDNDHYYPDTPLVTVATLDEPVDTVSVSMANDRADRSTDEYYSALIAYDEEGNQIAIAENTDNYVNKNRTATVLKVTRTAESRIYAIGISTLQNATFFDNLRMVIVNKPLEAQDVTPPEISYTVEKEQLWPPNHEMMLAVSDITASDDSGEEVALDVAVESNQADDGFGDGSTSSDWKIVENDDGTVDVYLRAERSGADRVYTVLFRAEDTSGNVAEADAQVTVPHDVGAGDEAGNGNGDAGTNGNGNGNGQGR